MDRFLFSMFAVAAGLVALAEPCVLEKGYKPSDRQAAETATGEAGILPSTVPTGTPVTNAESRVEEPLPRKAKEKKLTGRPAKITSDTTVYNRKEGIASFEGHVHVDDEQYQMHADRVFLFFDAGKDSDSTNGALRANGTNDVHRSAGDVRRVVAIGHVAMTNDAHRAYGAKATYSKKNGLVVLYSGDGITAEVRDESKAQPQIVRGKCIRFWIDSEQVEVDDADLTGAAHSGGAASIKKALGK